MIRPDSSHNNAIVHRALLAVLLGAACGAASAASTERLTVGSAGEESQAHSFVHSISADGRYVAFMSRADNLVAGDTNKAMDVFVRDLETGLTERVSVSGDGTQGNKGSRFPSISGDGRYVAFVSDADNLVAGDLNRRSDVFVHDRSTGATTRVNISAVGTEARFGHSHVAAISDNGRFVAFSSDATNLVADDKNQTSDIFVRDLEAQTTERISLSNGGVEANNASLQVAISSDGRIVAFFSHASNLVPDDGNDQPDVFVRDRKTGKTTRVSVAGDGKEVPGVNGLELDISGNGRFVGFTSTAKLTPDDTNGRPDVFVHDRNTGTVERISVGRNGNQGDGGSGAVSISTTGRYVAFTSAAKNLVSGDGNAVLDVFVRDRVKGTTRRYSVPDGGGEANRASLLGKISGNGGVVAFTSVANNLVPDDTNRKADGFVRTR
jgi:Tol biopolymer transport system component